MQERVFTINRYNENRTSCEQICLRLLPDQSFYLSTLHYYNDWGDRCQRGDKFKGRYEETSEQILCFAEEKTDYYRFWDHEMQEGEKKIKAKPTSGQFVFEKKSGGLVCPIDWEGFLGKILSSSITPQKSLF